MQKITLLIFIIFFFINLNIINASAPCPNQDLGNYDCSTDGIIGFNDLIILLSRFGTATANESNLNILLKNWNAVSTPTPTPLPPISETGQGGFYYLDNWDAPNGPSYMTGGNVYIDWRDFEPVEGQYRWELLTEIGTNIGWRSYFLNRIQGTSINPAPRAANIIQGAYQNGKKLRFKLFITEGSVPLWLYGGEDKDGINPSSYGTICGHKSNATPDFDCNAATDIVIAITYPLYPTKEDNAEPVWWNPIFQEKLRTTLKVIGDKIESDPVMFQTIEFVEASLGSYGETILYGKGDTGHTDTPNQQMFRAAGYTNALYSQAVQTNLDSYFAAFQRLPIAVSLGNGLYAGTYNDGSGVDNVRADFFPKVTAKYGIRLYPKFAGFGPECKGYVGQDFMKVCPDNARCIYESFGGISQWAGWPWGGNAATLEQIFNCATSHKAYIIMMWTKDFQLIESTGNSSLLKAFENTYSKLQQLGSYKLFPN